MLNHKHLATWSEVLAGVCALALIAGCPTFTQTTNPLQELITLVTGDEVDPEDIERSLNNHAPEATAGDDQSVSAGSTILLDGTGSSDSDGDRLSYSWELVSGDIDIVFTPNQISSIVESETPADIEEQTTVTIRLTVSDGSAYDTDEIRVTIVPAE